MRRSSALIAGLLMLAVAPALAQPHIEGVEIGFNGRFFPGALTPIVISLRHAGASGVFDLEISQEVRSFTERSSVERLRLPVSLSPGSRKTISLDFPIQSVSTPLQIKLFVGSQSVAGTEIDLRERWSKTPLTLGLEVAQKSSLELIEPERLPRRWTSYDGVRRVLWGRLDPARLSSEQRTALHGWLLRGGELIILSGENWYEQSGTDRWWAHLVPIANGRVVRREFNNQEVSWLEGDLRSGARVVASDAGRPLVWERPVGNGRVVLVALDALLEEAHLPEQPRDERTTAEGDQVIVRALRAVVIPFPSREIIAGLLILFVIGVGLSGIMASRLSKIPLWIVLAAIALSLALWGYLHSPEFSGERYSLDLGVLRVWPDEPLAWEQSWYGVFFRGPQDELLSVTTDSVRAVQRPLDDITDDITVEIASLQTRSVRFRSERHSARFFHAERMIEPPIRFSVDSSVSLRKVRVYNQAVVPLQDAVVHVGENFYRLGTIAAQTEVVRSLGELERMSTTIWLESLSEERRRVFSQWGELSARDGLIGWLEDGSLWAKTDREIRKTVRMVIVQGG